MITSNQDKKNKPVVDNQAKGLAESTQKISESIKGVFDEKKLASINKTIEKISDNKSQDVKDLIAELHSLKQTIEKNSVKKWSVQVTRDSRGMISSLTYSAIE